MVRQLFDKKESSHFRNQEEEFWNTCIIKSITALGRIQEAFLIWYVPLATIRKQKLLVETIFGERHKSGFNNPVETRLHSIFTCLI